jgi:hypothetical protein
MLHSKQDFIQCLNQIVDPLEKYFTPGRSGIKCGWSGSSYPDSTAKLEAFARALWGMAPLWGGGNTSKLDPLFVQGIINGTDPDHPEYWGPIEDTRQALVETAPIGLALLLAPHVVWDPLTDKQKENFFKRSSMKKVWPDLSKLKKRSTFPWAHPTAVGSLPQVEVLYIVLPPWRTFEKSALWSI